jgi:hypothetical protein
MCRQVVKAAATGDAQVLKDARRIAGKGDEYVFFGIRARAIAP